MLKSIDWFRILLTFCSFCGNELSIPNADVCTHCGKFVKGSVTSEKKLPNKWWYFDKTYGYVSTIKESQKVFAALHWQ